jgi:hypothetical protein
MATNFPLRTEGEFELSSGEKVWIKTLNSYFRNKAQEAAGRAAHKACTPFRKGGVEYKDVVIRMQNQTPEDQATYIADGGSLRGEYYAKVTEELPDILEPERKPDETDEDWMKRLDSHMAEVNKLEVKREKKFKELYDKAKEAALGLPEKSRVQKCIDEYISRQFTSEFNTVYTFYTIYYSTRNYDERTELYFGDDPEKAVRIIADLDDSDRNGLADRYNEIDNVRPSEIPT